ncbi:hypothetical protein D3C75_898670 [compost metagenome]
MLAPGCRIQQCFRPRIHCRVGRVQNNRADFLSNFDPPRFTGNQIGHGMILQIGSHSTEYCCFSGAIASLQSNKETFACHLYVSALLNVVDLNML